jgi:hypothetical protein
LLYIEERAKALALLMFMKEKQDKSVKARMCANGRKQRGDWTKHDTTFASMSTEAVFITAVIKATRNGTLPILAYPVCSYTPMQMKTLR